LIAYLPSPFGRRRPTTGLEDLLRAVSGSNQAPASSTRLNIVFPISWVFVRARARVSTPIFQKVQHVSCSAQSNRLRTLGHPRFVLRTRNAMAVQASDHALETPLPWRQVHRLLEVKLPSNCGLPTVSPWVIALSHATCQLPDTPLTFFPLCSHAD